jgi:hypothetical protein
MRIEYGTPPAKAGMEQIAVKGIVQLHLHKLQLHALSAEPQMAGTHGDSKEILVLARLARANPASDDGTLVSGRTTPSRHGSVRRLSFRLSVSCSL